MKLKNQKRLQKQQKLKNKMRNFLLLLSILILSSCATNIEQNVQLDDYSRAMNFLKVGNYMMAGEIFEQIEDKQPFTTEATNGLIMSSYAYYKAQKYEDSIRVIDYFIQSNPINENIPYLYYLKGLNYYDRITSMAKGRNIIENANSTFNELIIKYPNTPYAEDAKKKLSKVQTYLSGNEMNIGTYYLKRKNYLGAINHYKKVLQNYPNSNFVPEVLYRLVEINLILNLKFEADNYNDLLNQKYTNSVWAKNSTKLINQYDKNNK